jgi:hypothetical protein
MIPYDSILQLVNGKVYSLHHIWSSYHIHVSAEESVVFYGVSPADGQLLIAYKNGKQFIYSGIPADMITGLDRGEDIYPLLSDLENDKYPKEQTDASITQVPLQDVIDNFCLMQDHIAMTNGLWATDVPEKFKDHPDFNLLFQIRFEGAKK